jgi:hypothetical protein
VACNSFEDFSPRISVQVLISQLVSVLHLRKEELLALYSLCFCKKKRKLGQCFLISVSCGPVFYIRLWDLVSHIKGGTEGNSEMFIQHKRD